MKYLIAIAAACSLFACQAGTSAKVRDVLEKIECKAKVLSPYEAYFLSDQFEESVKGRDYVGILVAANISPAEIEQVVQAFKACDVTAQ